jgi:hypothetical protein
MKANPFNLCSTCINNTVCVLTHVKDKVWSCSEFEKNKLNKTSETKTIKINPVLQLI